MQNWSIGTPCFLFMADKQKMYTCSLWIPWLCLKFWVTVWMLVGIKWQLFYLLNMYVSLSVTGICQYEWSCGYYWKRFNWKLQSPLHTHDVWISTVRVTGTGAMLSVRNFTSFLMCNGFPDTGRSHLCRFSYHDVAVIWHSNLHCFSNLCKNFWFKVILHRLSMAILILCGRLAVSDVTVLPSVTCMDWLWWWYISWLV